MKFFTGRPEYIDNPYLLIKIGDYLKINDFTRWEEVFIDPGVYELIKSDKYSWEDTLDIREFLDSLPKNHYFAADYPCDMNLQYTDRFLDKSWNNAIRYCNHPQYIVTVQSQFNNYWWFVQWFDKYNKLNIESGILGLGNSCRIHQLTEFIKHSLDYAFKHCNHPRIHIYGLAMKIIPYAYNLAKRFNIKLSMDSTKWTRPITKELKQECGISCNKENIKKYFETYLQELKRRGIKVNENT
jgi:hypothetical protein